MDIKKFIFNKMTFFAILFAMLYQIFMIGIYIGGYRYTSEHTKNATIIYVNNDGQNGAKLINEIAKNMEFKSKNVDDISKAKDDLRDHKAVLVMEVPKNYTENLADGKKVQLNYYINSAGDQMSKTFGTTISTKVTDKLNTTITSKKIQGTMVKLLLTANQDKIKDAIGQAITANPEMASDPVKMASMRKEIMDQYTKQFSKQAKELGTLTNVKNNTVDLNSKSTNMNYLMAPMMSALAGFVAAMTSSTILFSSFDLEAKKKAKDKWKAFFSLQIIYMLVSIAASLTVATLLICINHISWSTAFQIFGASFLNLIISFQVLNVTTLLLGPLSIVINIPLVLVQAITSGGIMSAPLMPPFYRFIREFLPVPSTYQLNLNILYNTSSSLNPVSHLLLIGVCALIIECFLIFIKYRKDQEIPKVTGPMDVTGF
ncbi:ABC transporter permease [Limosilactobacillus balticus]|uniref:ABC transporter permease n=1 Tax=Limosilactobacillus balticus TaxID=2759747 RepID=UPI001E5C3166|nr:ABC transporter permease [Limosilactobacillus balticus]MCD7132142.1 ABC transporter permease [Limosilactobacillus balticus]